MRVATMGTILWALAQSAWSQDPSMLALEGRDPVELCNGKDVAGDPALTAWHHVFLYRFASEKNRGVFQKDPERWGVQMGGACGRMGPGSGIGDPARFHVHDGRIHLFASEGCRNAFKKKPEAYIDFTDAPVTADAASSAKARELLDVATRAHGGAARFAELKSLRFVEETKTKLKDGGERGDGRREVVAFDVGYVKESWYGPDWKWRSVRLNDVAKSFEVSNRGESTTLHASASHELLRDYGRHPIVILRERKREDFRAGFDGDALIGDRAVKQVATSYAGITTTLSIDAASGLVVAATHRGRGPQSTVGMVHRRFSDFRDVGGLKIAFKAESLFDEKPLPASTWTSVEADIVVDPLLFFRPK